MGREGGRGLPHARCPGATRNHSESAGCYFIFAERLQRPVHSRGIVAGISMHNKRPVSPVLTTANTSAPSLRRRAARKEGWRDFSFSPLFSSSIRISFISLFSFSIHKLHALRLPLWTFFLREVHLTRCGEEWEKRTMRTKRDDTRVERIFERKGERKRRGKPLRTKFNERKSDLHSSRRSRSLPSLP